MAFCKDLKNIKDSEIHSWRVCWYCGEEFPILKPKKGSGGSYNRRYCSYSHSKKAQLTRVKIWREQHPESNKKYYAKKIKKNPNLEKEKHKRQRKKKLELLGGVCSHNGCNISFWKHLQIDYIPGQKKLGWRHPQSMKFFIDNINEFQLLCANHHQEKTIDENAKGYGGDNNVS